MRNETMSPNTSVEKLAPELADRAVETFVRSFFDDPLFEWVFEDPAERARASAELFGVFVKYGLRHGFCTELERGQAATIWMEPGKHVGMLGLARCGFLNLPFRFGLGRFLRFAGANDQMEKIHNRVVRGPHWYLIGIGVDPDLQGRGRGSMLVREGTKAADAANVPVYLETSRPRNIEFYNRHGFEVAEETTLGKDGPPAWAMVRPARAVEVSGPA